MKVPPSATGPKKRAPGYSKDRNLTRRTVKGAAGGMKGVDYEDPKHAEAKEAQRDAKAVAKESALEAAGFAADADASPFAAPQVEGEAAALLPAHLDDEADPTRPAHAPKDEAEMILDDEDAMTRDQKAKQAAKHFVPRDRFTVDKDAPKKLKKRKWNQDEEEDQALYEEKDPEDIDLSAIAEAIYSADDKPQQRGHLFKRRRRAAPGDPGLTSPDEIQRRIGSPTGYAKHAIILAEAFRRTTGATRYEAISYLATMFVALKDREFARAALKEFGPGTGILDIYPLEIVEHILQNYPAFLKKVGYGHIFRDVNLEHVNTLSLEVGQVHRLEYSPNLKIRGFALCRGHRVGYRFEPAPEQGVYHLSFGASGNYQVLISALSRHGYTLLDRLQVMVVGDASPITYSAVSAVRSEKKIAAWPKPVPAPIDPFELLSEEAHDEDDGLMSSGELVTRQQMGALKGPKGDNETYDFRGLADHAEEGARAPEAAVAEERAIRAQVDVEGLSQAEESLLKLALLSEVEATDLRISGEIVLEDSSEELSEPDLESTELEPDLEATDLASESLEEEFADEEDLEATNLAPDLDDTELALDEEEQALLQEEAEAPIPQGFEEPEEHAEESIPRTQVGSAAELLPEEREEVAEAEPPPAAQAPSRPPQPAAPSSPPAEAIEAAAAEPAAEAAIEESLEDFLEDELAKAIDGAAEGALPSIALTAVPVAEAPPETIPEEDSSSPEDTNNKLSELLPMNTGQVQAATAQVPAQGPKDKATDSSDDLPFLEPEHVTQIAVKAAPKLAPPSEDYLKREKEVAQSPSSGRPKKTPKLAPPSEEYIEKQKEVAKAIVAPQPKPFVAPPSQAFLDVTDPGQAEAVPPPVPEEASVFEPEPELSPPPPIEEEEEEIDPLLEDVRKAKTLAEYPAIGGTEPAVAIPPQAAAAPPQELRIEVPLVPRPQKSSAPVFSAVAPANPRIPGRLHIDMRKPERRAPTPPKPLIPVVSPPKDLKQTQKGAMMVQAPPPKEPKEPMVQPPSPRLGISSGPSSFGSPAPTPLPVAQSIDDSEALLAPVAEPSATPLLGGEVAAAAVQEELSEAPSTRPDMPAPLVADLVLDEPEAKPQAEMPAEELSVVPKAPLGEFRSTAVDLTEPLED